MKVPGVRLFILLVVLTAAGALLFPRVQALGQSPTTAASAAKRDALPASEAAATAILAASPRHGDWINVMDRATLTRTYVVHAPQAAARRWCS